MGPKQYDNTNSRHLEKLIRKIAYKQSLMTLGCVIVIVIISISSYYFITNVVGAAFLSIILMYISIPIVTKFSKETKLHPSVDYEGYWYYDLTFEVVIDNNSDYYKDAIDCLLKRFDGKSEYGVTHIEKKGLELRVVYAKGNVKDGAQIRWESDPAIFDKNSIRWFFIGEILLTEQNRKIMKDLSCDLNGFEYYRVDARDEQNRPTHMTGKLLGCNQVMGHFSMKADITYKRISKEEYDKILKSFLPSEEARNKSTSNGQQAHDLM